jgi:hypothetical protein
MDPKQEESKDPYPENDIYVSRLNNKSLQDLIQSINMQLRERDLETDYDLIDPVSKLKIDEEHL